MKKKFSVGWCARVQAAIPWCFLTRYVVSLLNVMITCHTDMRGPVP